MANKTVIVRGKKGHMRKVKTKGGSYKLKHVKASSSFTFRKRSK